MNKSFFTTAQLSKQSSFIHLLHLPKTNNKMSLCNTNLVSRYSIRFTL